MAGRRMASYTSSAWLHGKAQAEAPGQAAGQQTKPILCLTINLHVAEFGGRVAKYADSAQAKNSMPLSPLLSPFHSSDKRRTRLRSVYHGFRTTIQLWSPFFARPACQENNCNPFEHVPSSVIPFLLCCFAVAPSTPPFSIGHPSLCSAFSFD